MIRLNTRVPKCFLSFALLLFVTGGAKAAPQAPPVDADQTGPHISADSPPYHLEFDGTQGAFTQRAAGTIPAQRFSVSYLHTDAGPTGYSRHLAWFLARDAHGFALLWCYLDDAGKQFWCWLYQYPQNTLTTQQFTGEYKFAAPPDSTKDSTEPGFSLVDAPPYVGPEFAYPGWTRKGGMIAKLNVFSSLSTEKKSAASLISPDSIPNDEKPTRTLTKLAISPLRQLQVGGANGWRAGGWEELHAFARDAAGDPFYLILYSNSKLGFVIDLKRSHTYTADFGTHVTFNDDVKGYGPQGNPADHPEVPAVQRNQAYEIAVTSTKTYDNPYLDVFLDVELVGPDRRTIRIPGFWDGAKSWKVRFAPTKVGNWTWKTFSNDKDIDAKIGVVECTPETDPTVGFMHVHPYRSHSRHFAIGQATSFYPAYVYDPVQFDPTAPASTAPTVKTASASAQADSKVPASFIAFQTRMDKLHAAGFNRLTGGYVLQGDTALGEPRNEGGAAFVNGDLLKLNPEYFRWMEKRIAYCNSLGMIPDIGIARSSAVAFSANNDSQLRALWRYMLARFSGYDVCWNMFGAVSADNTEALSRIAPFAQMAGKYDLFHHPLTTGLLVTDAFIKANAPPTTPKNGSAIGRIRVTTQEGPLLGLPTWLDVITLQSTDPKVLFGLDALKKPMVMVADYQTAASNDDEARAMLWGVKMRSGYFTIDQASGPAPSLDSPLLKAMETCDTFFKKTHYSRLEPHMEMLTAREESPEQTRKRHLANILAGIPVNTGDPVAANDPKAPPPQALVLSDPSREYVLYFQHGGNVNLDLLEATGHIKVTWLNPRTGESKEDIQIVGGSYHVFSTPDDKDWVLFLQRV